MWVHLWAFRARSIDTFDLGSASWIRVKDSSTGHQIPPPPLLGQTVPQPTPFTLQSQTEVAPPPAMVAVPTSEDAHAHMDRMLEIKRYMGIGCPRIHLRLYSTVMRAHNLEEAKMIILFPMSLSGMTQRRELEALRQRPDETVTSFIPVGGRRLPRSLIDHLRGIKSA
ncbi:hypothetical protein CK203_110375 [Vitis vinifera]|uniref:Uncharacterized protein n=1 Tax=Vitis vinifera TaxID=29760 RepID=A0A438FEW1_VITVI|nr:hypothetical protein CK203_110375 [Vitis vinifera]